MSNGETYRSSGWIERIAHRLGPGKILAILATLFVLDVVVPDFIPFVDEIVLGLLTALAALWRARDRTRPDKPPPKNVTPR